MQLMTSLLKAVILAGIEARHFFFVAAFRVLALNYLLNKIIEMDLYYKSIGY